MPAKPYPFYSLRANVAGGIVAVLLVLLLGQMVYGTPLYAPFLAYQRLPQLHAGMSEPDVWRTLGVRSHLWEGSGPGNDYRVGYRLPFGSVLGLRWDRTTRPARLNRAVVRTPWGVKSMG